MSNTTDPLLDALIDSIAQRAFEKLVASAENTDRNKDFYTVDDLAERFSLSKDAVRERVRAGEFGDVLRLGDRCYRVPAEGVQKYEREHMTAAHTGRPQKARGPRRQASRAGRDPGPI